MRLWPNWTDSPRNKAMPSVGDPQNPRPGYRGWSLRVRFLLFLTVALLPIAAVIVLQGMDRARLDTETIRDRLIQSARTSANEEQNIIDSAEQLLRAVSRIGDVRFASKDCSTILAGALHGVTYFLNIARMNPQGIVICSGVPSAMNYNVASNPVFLTARTAGDKLVVGNLQESPVLHRPVIAVMLPIYDQSGAFNGTVSLAVDVRWMDYMMHSADVPKDAVVAVLDRSGRIVSSNGAEIAKQLFAPALASNAGEDVWLSGKDASGNNWSYAVSALVGNAAYVGFAMQDRVLFGQTYIHMGIDFLLPFAMIGIAWIAIWIATERQVTQWILYLRRIATAYRSGHYSIRPQLTGAPTEFNLLAQAMSEMAGAIQDRDKRLREAVVMKSTLIKEIHHRVKNNLQIVMSLLSLQANRVAEPSAREALMQAQTRINALALVHRILNDIEDQTTVDVKRLLEELAQQVAEGMSDARSIRIIADVTPREVPGSAAVPIALYTVEALTNIFKHAYPGNKNGTIRVSLHSAGPGMLKLAIADDGIGYAPDASGRSIGSRLLENFGRQLGGQSAVSSDAERGTTVELTFPEPEPGSV